MTLRTGPEDSKTLKIASTSTKVRKKKRLLTRLIIKTSASLKLSRNRTKDLQNNKEWKKNWMNFNSQF
jgi:hypothetical protein